MSSYIPLAFITAITASGSAEAKRIVTGKGIAMSPVTGGFVLGIFLFAFGMVNENVATKLCVLIIITSLLVNGQPVFKLLTEALKPKTIAKTPLPGAGKIH